MGTLLMLIRINLPRLIGIGTYGIIAIVLAAICYMLFSKILPLNTGVDATSQDSLAAVILAVGSIIGLSLVVAVTAFEPSPVKIPNSYNINTSGKPVASGCSGCGAAPKAGKKSTAPKSKVTTTEKTGKPVE